MPLRRLALTAAAGLLTLSAASCYFPGGPGYSADRFTYESTTWRPWTVTLVDTRTSQTVWSVDVPVGKQVVVAFKEGEGTKDGANPDIMNWEIMPIGTRTGTLRNSVPVPGASARRLDPILRPTPELPEDMNARQPALAPLIEVQPQPSGAPAEAPKP